MKSLALPRAHFPDGAWPGAEGPETLDLGAMHYLMTPRQALLLALKAEESAEAFFGNLGAAAQDQEVQSLSASFAAEEREHVRLIRRELEKYPESEERIREDMDPPIEL